MGMKVCSDEVSVDGGRDSVIRSEEQAGAVNKEVP